MPIPYTGKNEPKLPRAGQTSFKTTDIKYYRELLKQYPHLKKYTLGKVSKIFKTFNEEIIKAVTVTRDGIELPNGLGYLFVGSCKKKKTDNIDFMASMKAGILIRNQNLESNQWLAKIFYTNYETKYSFKNHELWFLLPARRFRKIVSDAYIKDYTRYIIIDNVRYISKLFRQRSYKMYKENAEQKYLESGKHNEFDL